MKARVECTSVTEIECDLLVVNEFEGVKHPGGATGAVDKALGGLITELSIAGEIDGKLGKATVIHTQKKIPAKHVVVVGLGKSKEFGLEEVRIASAVAIKKASEIKAKTVATIVHGAGIGGLDPQEAAQALVEGSLLGGYQYKGYKSKKEEDDIEIAELIIVERDGQKSKKIAAGAKTGEIIAQATNCARDLVNAPANKATPQLLVRHIEKMAKEEDLSVKILELPEVKKLKMEAFFNVAKGSEEPAKIVVLEYKGSGGKDQEKIGLVGKGITFDAGGISLKSPRKMWEMKTDMAGAATIIEAMRAIAQLKVKKNVIAVVPLTENMPDGGAQKPGDISSSLAGKTIEVISTDAEGRMIVADALAYAIELGATKVIDVATLTGGCVVALGDVTAGVMGNNQELLDQVLDAGKRAGEKMWPLPLHKEYKKYLKSQVADIKNCTEKGKASPITGGIFLQEFVGETPWVHIDIAGTAFKEESSGYLREGATGAGVRTLLRLLRQ